MKQKIVAALNLENSGILVITDAGKMYERKFQQSYEFAGHECIWSEWTMPDLPELEESQTDCDTLEKK